MTCTKDSDEETQNERLNELYILNWPTHPTNLIDDSIREV